MALKFEYPASFKSAAEGGFVVRFPDLPEAITQGDDLSDAIEQAIDCLDEAIANRIELKMELPIPSQPKRGQRMIPVPTSRAAIAALYMEIRKAGISKVELAGKLGVDEKAVRRLLNPHHKSKMPNLEEALDRMGKKLVLTVEDVEEVASTR